MQRQNFERCGLGTDTGELPCGHSQLVGKLINERVASRYRVKRGGNKSANDLLNVARPKWLKASK